jgi:hypothetical protein
MLVVLAELCGGAIAERRRLRPASGAATTASRSRSGGGRGVLSHQRPDLLGRDRRSGHGANARESASAHYALVQVRRGAPRGDRSGRARPTGRRAHWSRGGGPGGPRISTTRVQWKAGLGPLEERVDGAMRHRLFASTNGGLNRAESSS